MGKGELKIENWMTVKDYAVKRGVTIHAVYKAIERGKLTTRRIGSTILVFSDN